MDFGAEDGETPGGEAILAGNLNSKSDMGDDAVKNGNYSPGGPDADGHMT